MRFLAAVLGLCAFSAAAFDSEAWLGKREVMTREAERLRAAYKRCQGELKTPAEDVTLPVETFENGSVKTMVVAKKVHYFLDRGLVWAEGVTVRRLRDDGTVEMLIEAASCVVDRQSKSGWAEGPAKVTCGKTVLSGRGVYFTSAESYVKIFEETSVDLQGLKFEGVGR